MTDCSLFWLLDWLIDWLIDWFCTFYSSRQNRSSDNVTFSEDRVHILPGYPRQVFHDPPTALLAFFLQFPRRISEDFVQKDVVKAIIESDVSSVEEPLGGTIMSVQPLISTTVASSEGDDKSTSISTGAIIGICVALILLAVIFVAIVLYCKRGNR